MLRQEFYDLLEEHDALHPFISQVNEWHETFLEEDIAILLQSKLSPIRYLLSLDKTKEGQLYWKWLDAMVSGKLLEQGGTQC